MRVVQAGVLFRRGRKPELVRSAHRASGGLAFMLVAVVGSVLSVSDVVPGRDLAPGGEHAPEQQNQMAAVVPLRRRDDDDAAEDEWKPCGRPD